MTHTQRPYDELTERLSCLEDRADAFDRRLRALECDGMNARLQALADLIGRSQHEVITRLTRIEAGTDAEVIAALRAHVEKLGSLGSSPDDPVNTEKGT